MRVRHRLARLGRADSARGCGSGPRAANAFAAGAVGALLTSAQTIGLHQIAEVGVSRDLRGAEVGLRRSEQRADRAGGERVRGPGPDPHPLAESASAQASQTIAPRTLAASAGS